VAHLLRSWRRATGFGFALSCASATLSACGSCGDKAKDKGSEEANTESSAEPDPTGIRPFRVRWDGGRRLRPHRRAPNGDSLFPDDAGSMEHDP
jgi:hypothetical protein